jgi:hypothetical protein
MEKLGYVRGPSSERGWFADYRKNYPTLGLDVVVEFSGQPVFPDKRMVALKSLSFVRAEDRHDAAIADRLPFEKIPPVLLTESIHDGREIAGKGTGFDPNWRKVVG